MMCVVTNGDSSMFRAKLKVNSVEHVKNEDGDIVADSITMSAVSASQYPEDGQDENNTFAMFTPAAYLSMTVNNPNLLGEIQVGQEFYVDFTLLGKPVPEEELAAAAV